MNTFGWIAVVGLLSIGLIGTVVPAVPGIGLIWAGIFLYALLTGFQTISGLTVVMLGVLCALTAAASYWGGAAAARAGGGGRRAMLGAIAGMVLGLLAANVLGLFIGGFLGALLGAWWESRQAGPAFKTAFLTVGGMLLGTTLQLVVGVALIVTFFFKVWGGG